MKIIRKKTTEISVGKVKIGGSNPIIVQSMLKSRTGSTALIRKEIKDLEKEGCEIIRMAIPDRASLLEMKNLIGEKAFKVPVVADIHFDTGLAVEAIECGADCVRVNPGNMGGAEKLARIALRARERKSALRIGVNSGSLDKKILRACSGNVFDAMVHSVLEVVNLFEKLDFFNFKISAKASSVLDTIAVYKILSSKIPYPLHLGITEAGPQFSGVIKSAVGMGILLSKGIGDTIRVSLTDLPVNEVRAAYTILGSLNLRQSIVDIISCPTCGRTRVDLKKIVLEVENMTRGINKKLRVAVMGCIVNGPGEAREADIGIAYGIKKAAIFTGGKIMKRIEISSVLEEFEKELQNILKRYN